MKNLIEFNGLYFNEETPEKVMQIVTNNIGKETRLRFWYGDKVTGRSWNEENYVTGYIGRSTGTKKIPLLIAKTTSFGGGALLTDCIVKIVNTKTKVILYQHENFNQAVFTVSHPSDLPEYAANVLADNDMHARFKKLSSAIRYANFMNGKRHNK